MKRLLQGVLCFLWVSSCGAESIAPRYGSPLARGATELAKELPGSPSPTTLEQQAFLAEALAEPALIQARGALNRRDLEACAQVVSKARWGDTRAMAPYQALALLASYRAPSLPALLLPPVEDEASYRKYLEEAKEDLNQSLKSRAIRSSWKRWMRGLPDRLPKVSQESLDLKPYLSTLGPAGAEGWTTTPKDPNPAVYEYRLLAWSRRAAFEVLHARLVELEKSLASELKEHKIGISGSVATGKSPSPPSILLTLAGGRLGTVEAQEDGRFAFEAPLSDLAKIVRSEGTLTLKAVKDRKEVYRRSISGARFLSSTLVGVGQLKFAPFRGNLRVYAPTWEDLLAGEKEAYVASVRVDSTPRPQLLDATGRTEFRDIRSGVHLVSLEVKDKEGSLRHQAFAVVSVPAGEGAEVELPIAHGEAPSAQRRESLDEIRSDMENLAQLYRTGQIADSTFRKAVGSIYRLHRKDASGKDQPKAFVLKITELMRSVFQTVKPPEKSSAPEELLSTWQENLEDLREILPTSLQIKRPSGRLLEQVREAKEASRAKAEGFESVYQKRQALIRAQEIADELGGVTSLILDVLGPRLRAIEAKLEKAAKAYEANHALYRLSGRDIELRFVNFAEEDLGPMLELVETASKLVREHVTKDLREWVRQAAREVEADGVKLRVSGKNFAQAKKDAAEARERLARRAASIRSEEMLRDWAQMLPAKDSLSEDLPSGAESLSTTAASLLSTATPEALLTSLPEWVPASLEELGAMDPKNWEEPRVKSLIQSEGSIPKLTALCYQALAEYLEVARRAQDRTTLKVFDEELRSRLVEIFERGASQDTLEELSQLPPISRRKKVLAQTGSIYAKNKIEPLPEDEARDPLVLKRAQAWLAQAWIRAKEIQSKSASPSSQ